MKDVCMNRDTELVPIDSIIVEDRLREDYGDIAGLAESIQEHGLIHPIAIDQDNRLIAGERRLRAMQRIGFTEAECRRWQDLDDDERRVIELEENLRRKDLTSYERDKNLADYASAVADADKQRPERVPLVPDADTEAKPGRDAPSREGFRAESAQQPEPTALLAESASKETRPESGRVSRGTRGPAQTPGSLSRVSGQIGIPKQTIHDARKRVEGSGRYPFLQQPAWNQYRAMEAADLLDSIPTDDREAIVGMASEPGVDPTMAIRMIKNLAEATDRDRRRILALATSDDDRDRAVAKNRAVAQPATPDGRITLLSEIVRRLGTCVREYPGEPDTEDLKRIIGDIKAVQQSIKERHQRRVEDAA